MVLGTSLGICFEEIRVLEGHLYKDASVYSTESNFDRQKSCMIRAKCESKTDCRLVAPSGGAIWARIEDWWLPLVFISIALAIISLGMGSHVVIGKESRNKEQRLEVDTPMGHRTQILSD